MEEVKNNNYRQNQCHEQQNKIIWTINFQVKRRWDVNRKKLATCANCVGAPS